MDTAETPEERRARLKALAKARVERLVGGQDVAPHMDRPENQLLTQEEADRGLANLVESGIVEFPIRDKDIRVVRIKEDRSPGKHCLICSVSVDGEPAAFRREVERSVSGFADGEARFAPSGRLPRLSGTARALPSSPSVPC